MRRRKGSTLSVKAWPFEITYRTAQLNIVSTAPVLGWHDWYTHFSIYGCKIVREQES